MFTGRDELGVVPEEVLLALGDAVSRSSVDDFFGLILKLVFPLRLAVPFLAEVCYAFVTGVWEEELLAAGDLVGYIG